MRQYKFLFSFIYTLFIFTNCSMSLGLGYDDETIKDTIKQNYIEIFSDDFNGNNLDPSKWRKVPELKKGAYGFWKPECSYIQNGNLILEQKAKTNTNGTKILCSGAIESKVSKNDFTRGLYEIKFRITEPTNGLIYAFWFMNDEMKDPNSNDGTEIDFFEVVPNEKFISSGIHYGNYLNNLHSRGRTLTIDNDFYNIYHILQFFWDKYCYEVYLDGTFIYRLDVADCGGKRTTPGYLRISAEYGAWTKKDFIPEIPDPPSLFYIDYVKVYEKK